jgi:acyl dehydratase
VADQVAPGTVGGVGTVGAFGVAGVAGVAGVVPAEPFRMVVEEGKVHEFARATRSRSPEHLRPRDPTSPVTFLASCALWMGEENSAWRGVTRDFANILHGEQEFTFPGPPPAAGTELIGLQSIDRTYAKTGARGGAMTFTEVVTRFRKPASERTVAEMRSVSIHKHPGSAAAAAPTRPVRADPAEPGRSDAGGRTALEPFTDRALTITDFVRYQGASGDFNAIHHDTAFAQASGYPGPFAVGMLTAGVAANYVTAHFGVDAVRRIRVRWKDQAWPGDALTYQGFRLARGPAAAGPTGADVEVQVTRPDGRSHLVAWVDLADQAGTDQAGDPSEQRSSWAR